MPKMDQVISDIRITCRDYCLGLSKLQMLCARPALKSAVMVGVQSGRVKVVNGTEGQTRTRRALSITQTQLTNFNVNIHAAL